LSEEYFAFAQDANSFGRSLTQKQVYWMIASLHFC